MGRQSWERGRQSWERGRERPRVCVRGCESRVRGWGPGGCVWREWLWQPGAGPGTPWGCAEAEGQLEPGVGLGAPVGRVRGARGCGSRVWGREQPVPQPVSGEAVSLLLG